MRECGQTRQGQQDADARPKEAEGKSEEGECAAPDRLVEEQRPAEEDGAQEPRATRRAYNSGRVETAIRLRR